MTDTKDDTVGIWSTMSNDQISDEFERLASLRDQCQLSMGEIRDERARRKTAEIDRLTALLAPH